MLDQKVITEIRNTPGIEVKRPRFAHACVNEVASKEEKYQSEYRSYVKKTPALIKTNGLGQTLAFMYSKSDPKKQNSWELLLSHIRQYLLFRGLMANCPDSNTFLEAIIGLNAHSYYRITDEVLTFVSWLGRFSEGRLKKENS